MRGGALDELNSQMYMRAHKKTHAHAVLSHADWDFYELSGVINEEGR